MINKIRFPGLNLEFTINRVAFSVFGKEIFWYALIILTGFFLGVVFVLRDAKKQGIDPDNIFDIAFWGLIVSVICARIYYVIFDPGCLDGNLLNIFKIWEGGLAIYGALIGAVATAFVYCRIKKLPILKIFDVCAPGLFIGQIIGRWGNFVNAEVYGRETSLPWRMSINGKAGVHPLFLYESLWNLLGFILILIFRKRKKTDGQIFFFYSLWYGVGRLFLEGMRQTQYILYLIPNKLGISQVVAFAVIIISTAALIFLHKKRGNNKDVKYNIMSEKDE